MMLPTGKAGCFQLERWDNISDWKSGMLEKWDDAADWKHGMLPAGEVG